jgi:hypothetical protein
MINSVASQFVSLPYELLQIFCVEHLTGRGRASHEAEGCIIRPRQPTFAKRSSRVPKCRSWKVVKSKRDHRFSRLDAEKPSTEPPSHTTLGGLRQFFPKAIHESVNNLGIRGDYRFLHGDSDVPFH